jgi:hypothetical protein
MKQLNQERNHESKNEKEELNVKERLSIFVKLVINYSSESVLLFDVRSIILNYFSYDVLKIIHSELFLMVIF